MFVDRHNETFDLDATFSAQMAALLPSINWHATRKNYLAEKKERVDAGNREYMQRAFKASGETTSKFGITIGYATGNCFVKAKERGNVRNEYLDAIDDQYGQLMASDGQTVGSSPRRHVIAGFHIEKIRMMRRRYLPEKPEYGFDRRAYEWVRALGRNAPFICAQDPKSRSECRMKQICDTTRQHVNSLLATVPRRHLDQQQDPAALAEVEESAQAVSLLADYAVCQAYIQMLTSTKPPRHDDLSRGRKR